MTKRRPQTVNNTRILARIQELEVERDRFTVHANQRISSYNGAIGELKALLEPAEPKKPTKEDA